MTGEGSHPVRNWLPGTVFAHRGLHDDTRLENSIPAFEAAIAAGYGIECDVQRSREHAPLVFHDWELDRLTGRSGAVMQCGADELAEIALSGEGNGTIPQLSDVLALVAGRVPLLVEVKSRRDLPFKTFCCAIHDALDGYSGPLGVMSFDPRVARWFRKNAPGLAGGLVVTEQEERNWRGHMRRQLALRHARPDFLAWDIRDLPSTLAQAQRAKGLPLASWTVKTPDLRARADKYADAPIAEDDGFA